MILEKINQISDLKKLNKHELTLLAKELRDLIIDTTSENGGHLASSLGVVELTIAILLSLDLPKDKVIWDVGHQSYAYKILTDRKDRFHTLRLHNGISGFPKIKESIYDSFDTGHSSTSISAGMGYAYARNLNKDDFTVVSVIGDGSLTGGIAFEALNNLNKLDSNFIIILNDNEMSISESSGGIKHALMGLRTSYRYIKLKEISKKFLHKLSGGKLIEKLIIRLNYALKQIFVSKGMIFEDMDIIYLGPIDGHNIELIKNTILKAKKLDSPCVIHVKTIKGKGYKYAEENPTFYHGVSPYYKETGELKKKNTNETWTKIFANKIIEKAGNNKNIVTITAAMADGTGLIDFSKKYPDRFFDVGICEQHAVTFAAGLALNKKIPIVCVYSTFLQRAFDQIIHDVCLENLHVVFMVDRAGIVGSDGETHQGIYDIAFLKMLPNMTIMAPKNKYELEQMIDFAIDKVNGPVAIRYPRGEASDDFSEHKSNIEYAKSELIEDGDDIVFYALGNMLKYAKSVKEILKTKKLNPCLINARFANPIDKEFLARYLQNKKFFVTFEEGVKYGGMGESLCSYINENFDNIKTDIIALPNVFIEQGSRDELLKDLYLDVDTVATKIINRYEQIKR